MQNHYNLIYREEEREMIPLCVDQGVGVIPWSPLARGFLEGDRKRERGEGPTKRAQTDQMQKDMYFHDDDFEIAGVAQKIAKEHGVTPTQIACAWILQAPGVTAPIIGATKTHHLKQAFEAVDIKLSAEEVRALEKPYRPHPILGHEQPQAAKMLK
jgi:1-deoxyxylulose-5-phosphate synthase